MTGDCTTTITTVLSALSWAQACVTVLSSCGLHASDSFVAKQWLGFPISSNTVLPPAWQGGPQVTVAPSGVWVALSGFPMPGPEEWPGLPGPLQRGLQVRLFCAQNEKAASC